MPNVNTAWRLGASQSITGAATSQTSGSAFSAGTTVIRVISTTATVNFRIGATPLTAVTTDPLLGLNVPEYFTITQGQSIACIGTGTVSITECS
jgi:hypothetical protein